MLKYTSGRAEDQKVIRLSEKRFKDISQMVSDKNILIASDKKNEVYLVSDDLLKIFNIIKSKKHPYTIGFYFGTINGEFTPGLETLYKYAKICNHHNVVISRKEEMRFLYGRDIRASQLRSFDKNIQPGEEVIICNKSNEAIGLGKVVEPLKKTNRSDVVINNLMDRGWYLRHKE
jgi:ribosome biogenesis protein Nip4